jgi:hypothetical protein
MLTRQRSGEPEGLLEAEIAVVQTADISARHAIAFLVA